MIFFSDEELEWIEKHSDIVETSLNSLINFHRLVDTVLRALGARSSHRIEIGIFLVSNSKFVFVKDKDNGGWTLGVHVNDKPFYILVGSGQEIRDLSAFTESLYQGYIGKFCGKEIVDKIVERAEVIDD